MNIERKTIYMIAGVGMIVGSFFSAARAMSGLIGIIYIAATTSNSSEAHDSAASAVEGMVSALYASQLGEGVAAVGSFLVLFFGGKWMLKGPKMLDRWINASEE